MMDSLIKITDRTEMLLPLDRGDVYEIVKEFREYCLNKYNDIFPRGFEKETIDERFGLSRTTSGQHQVRDSILQYFGYDVKSYKPIDCVVELLRNPRILKRSLAHTWSAWQNLHGEIYFDDLLVVHTIRVAAPKVFELLATHIRYFRLFIESQTKHSNENLCNRINLALKEQHDDIDSRIYHQLIKFLFPGWEIQNEDHSEKLAGKLLAETPHPQGVAMSYPADYFYRFTSEDATGDDQHTMKDIVAFNKGDVSEVILMNKMGDDAKYSARLEHFGRLLTPEKVLYLTSAYFKAAFEYDYRRFADFELTGQLWRIHLKNSASEETHCDWLEDMLSAYLPLSIRFANDIFYFWKFRKDSEAESKYVRPEIEQMYTNLIKTLFENEPEKLIKALSPKYIWTLRHLLFKNKNNAAIKKDEKFFSDWQPWFIDLLITASEINSKLVAMFIVPLLYDIQMSTTGDGDLEDETPKLKHGWKARYDETVASLLFGERLPEARRILSSLSEDDYSQDNLDEQEKCILDFAVSHSQKWRDEQGKSQRAE